MDAFSASLLALGGLTIYTYYDQYRYETQGDRNKTTGPETYTPQGTNDQQIAGATVKWVNDGQAPIVSTPAADDSANRMRQRMTRGSQPVVNTPVKPLNQPASPGLDLLSPAYKNSIVTYPIASRLLFQGYFAGSGSMSGATQNSQKYDYFHGGGRNSTLPGDWNAGDVAASDDAPSSSGFWDGIPGSQMPMKFVRGKPVPIAAQENLAFQTRVTPAEFHRTMTAVKVRHQV